MAIGLGVIGFAPEVFWRLTPKEFEAALRGRFGPEAGVAPLTHADLDMLMQRFPDLGDET
jgi:uncharacterized phage protein (TIGR02216 family)